jgi:DNA invertase Pin-like site-specific DNA recombinase
MSMTADVATGVLVGYIRVSTAHQTHAAQWDALTELGVPPERIYADKASGKRDDRPGLLALLAFLRDGDVVVVTDLSRLGRSLSSVIRTVEDLRARGIFIRSLKEGIDTSTSTGRMLAGIFASLAEYERELNHERVRAARVAAGESGRTGGRPRVLSADQCGAVVDLRAAGWSAARIADHLGVSRRTVYRCLESVAVSR